VGIKWDVKCQLDQSINLKTRDTGFMDQMSFLLPNQQGTDTEIHKKVQIPTTMRCSTLEYQLVTKSVLTLQLEWLA